MSAAPLVLVVEHHPGCPPALMADWLREAGCRLDVRRPHAGDPLPDPAEAGEFDAFVIMGGPMGANDDAEHHWLTPLKELVRAARAEELVTLGICLGHQVIAVALGGTVERNPLGQQVGLLKVGWTEEAGEDPLLGALATPRRGIQWNDDIVTELPDGALLLARAPRGEIQAVRFAETVWGVQLHPEVDHDVLAPWVEEDRARLAERGLDADALLAEIAAARGELDAAWRPLAERLATLAAERRRRRESAA